MEIGTQMYEAEQHMVHYYWNLRTSGPAKLEPVPGDLKKLKRCKRIYVMADNTKAGIQEGKRVRGAPKRVRDE